MSICRQTRKIKQKSNNKKVKNIQARLIFYFLCIRARSVEIYEENILYLCFTCEPPDERGVTDFEPDLPAPTLVEEAD